jgi:hypothetical protein
LLVLELLGSLLEQPELWLVQQILIEQEWMA